MRNISTVQLQTLQHPDLIRQPNAGFAPVQPLVSLQSRASQSKPNRRSPQRSRLMQPGFTLAPASDSGLLGDAKTTFASVNLQGLTAPNATVALQNTGLTTTANAEGKFLFADIPLALGTTEFTVIAQKAGQSRQFTAPVERVTTDNIDAVLEWNATLLRTIQLAGSSGLIAARSLAIAHTAIFDAVSALTGNNASYRPLPISIPVGASAEAAAAGAAHQVLTQLYPQQKSSLDTALAASLATIQDSETAETSGLQFGQAVANGILAERSRDGSTATVPYAVKIKPGQWRPTPSRFISAAAVAWKQVTPFVLRQGSQFRPAAPPRLTSKTYASDFEQVKRLGQITSRSRTTQQTEITRFWIGNSGTLTFPGVWNQTAAQAAAKSDQTLWQNAHLFAQLNVALADASIAAWDAKYTYRSWRPVTAIRLAGSDRNPATKADPTWQSLLETPAHPDYVSSHSTFAGAAAAVLTQQFGDSYTFTATSLDLPGIQRSFKTFEQAAAEAGMSRIYGGIHTLSANRAGLRLGRRVGNYVLQAFPAN